MYNIAMVASDARGLVSKAGVEFATSLLGVGHQHPRRSGHRILGVTDFWFLGSSRTTMFAVLRCLCRRTSTSSICVEKRDGEAASSSSARVEEGCWRGCACHAACGSTTSPKDRLILGVRAMDWVGLLVLLIRALKRAGADSVWAKVKMFGSTAVDVFCVVLPAKPDRGWRCSTANGGLNGTCAERSGR